ncbi:enoyl-CoA hydratase/isomerase family protein [Syntrophomonas palmitatica]|uniref:enoyl-CoA hydratase/isomerase family protein n=1 Tax=Syntrophomonas palmitatica TaxID=402877 RepID=UPI0006D05924|nr:enoyl-CoA hydratase/isomerase family protein [Syntrophomonas palmitatica]
MSYDSYETLKIEMLDNDIMLLGLNRPGKLNAVSKQMLDDLEDLWKKLRNDFKTRVVILRGEGEKGFCGGVDVKEGLTPDLMHLPGFYEYQVRLAELQLLMRKIPQPIIALIHGAAAGAGFSFSLASDIRIITPDARFSAFYINVGLGGADMSSSYFLPRHIGTGRAYEFLLTGRFMNAEEAMNLGFASRCVPKEELLDTALDMAKDIVAKEFIQIRLTKEAINANLDCAGLERALDMENRNQVLLVMHNMDKGRERPFG